MRISKFLTLFFLLLPLCVFAQWEVEQRMPFSVETRHATSLQSGMDLLQPNDLFYRDNLMLSRDFSSFNPSGDFLTNLFGNSYLETGLSTEDGHRNHLAISSIPLGNGIIFLLIISVLYFTVLLTKKHFIKMKTKINPSQSPLKGRLWPTHNVENSQTLKAPFRGLGGKLFLFFLTLFAGNTYAQLPLKAIPDNAFMPPGSGSLNLNVLRNDELGACNSTSIEIQLFDNTGTLQTSLTTGAGGTAVVSTDGDGNKIIIYTPASASFVGQDSLRYKISCSTKSSPDSALVLINVTEKPGNIIDNACAVQPLPVEWGIKKLAQSSQLLSVATVPLAGDLDNDKNTIEIVTMSSAGGFISSEFNIFQLQGTSLLLKYTVPIPTVGCSANSFVIANVDNDGYSSIFLVTHTDAISGAADSRYLIKYKFNGIAFVEQWRQRYSTNDTYASCFPVVADFMGTGNSQVAVYDKVYNAQNGTLLVNGNLLGVAGNNFGDLPHDYASPVTGTMAAADIDNDGKLEIVAGNCVYKINIANPTALVAGNTYQKMTTANASIGNGNVAIADMDGDGLLDITTSWISSSSTYLAVYNPRTGALMSNIINFGTAVISTPFIGDIDGDGKPDISLTGTYIMKTYHYDATQPVNTRLSLFWSVPTTDDSGATGMSLFDFNQDGISELIYRDVTDLRIINGSLKSHITGNDTIVYNLFKVAANSITLSEYPIVADVNKDGQAEIITIAHPTTLRATTGYLQIYSSLHPDISPWAPARSVWDRFYYNPVYISDSLTVPAHPLHPATKFVTKDGDYHYPFNNYLQQATLLNDEGKMLRLGPDLAFDKTEGDYESGTSGPQTGVHYATVNVNDLQVTVWVENQGDAVFPINALQPLVISAYLWDASIPAYVRKYTEYALADDEAFNDSIPDGNTRKFTFTIPGIISSMGGIDAHDALQLRLNELDNLFPMTAEQEECVYWNNFYPSGNYGAPNQVLCEGTDERLNFYPQNSSYTYIWYDQALTEIATGDYLDIDKDNSPVQSYYVRVYDGTTWVNENDDTHGDQTGYYRVDAWLASDSLIWTGNGLNNDWHDYNNWLDPNDLTPLYPKSKIPRPCTHVLIPDGLDYYASLDENSTTRTIYRDASCDHIHFEFGGEVAQTDRLTYTKAWIQYNFGFYNTEGNDTIAEGFTKGAGAKQPSAMERDQWYALSAPLNKIVTGDFSLGGKPHTWQKRFVRSDAQTGTFTGNFSWPDDNIKPNNEAELNDSLGYAIALLVADDNPGYNGEDWSGGYQAGLDTLKGIITLPYFEGPYDESDFDNSASHIHPHRVHKYDTGSKTSFFKEYWYYDFNLALTDHPQGSIQREDEAYRFIFDNQIVPIPSGTLIGKNAFKITVPTGKEIMLGNPFMSSLKFNNFYQANSTAINNYFRLYNGTFNTYEYNVGSASITDTIAVLQAFFITTTGIPGSTVDLYFPFETTSITRAVGEEHALKSPAREDFKDLKDLKEIKEIREDVIYVTATSHVNKNKATSATLALNQEGQNVYQLFYEASNNIPQVYFTDESGQKNAVQYSTENENQATTTIPLGLRSGFGNRVTLTFDINAEVEALTLLDKKTGQTQDLLQNNSYTFTQSDNTTPYIDRFALSFKSPTAISEIKNENKIAIYQDNETVTVSSPEKIHSVELFDMQGRKVKQANKIENNVYQIDLRRGVAHNAPTGVYIVKAVLGNGEAQTHKIIVK